jgi:phage terminase large subunit-like protein
VAKVLPFPKPRNRRAGVVHRIRRQTSRGTSTSCGASGVAILATTGEADVNLRDLPPEQLSGFERLCLLPTAEQKAMLDSLSAEQIEALQHDWRFYARPEQVAPQGDWRIWCLTGGRGLGKTRAAAEWVREERRMEKRPSRGLLVAPTPAAARDLMIEGDSGILTISPPSEKPTYEPSKLRLTWPNGTIASIKTAAEPQAIRGPHVGWAWGEEVQTWKYPDAAFNNLELTVRAGEQIRILLTFTPMRIPLIRSLLGEQIPGTVVTRSTTFRNAANLNAQFLAAMISRYGGTREGQRELYGELLEDVEGALLTMAVIDAARQAGTYSGDLWVPPQVPVMRRIVVGVDPPGGATECGIIVAGTTDAGPNGQGYVLDDRSLAAPPSVWGQTVVDAYHDWKADAVIAEKNYGGDMVAANVRTIDPSIRIVPGKATRGKVVRAEPIVAMYEQGRIHHVGRFPELEEEWTTWVPPGRPEASSFSPNRIDGCVWALTELMLGASAPASISRPTARVPKTTSRR